MQSAAGGDEIERSEIDIAAAPCCDQADATC
jgi:hypothetical protein